MTKPALREIRLSGTGGQGLQLATRVLAEALLLEGRHVAQSQSYEPTSRGGVSRADLVIGDGAIDFPLIERLDLLVVLDQRAAAVSEGMLDPHATVLSDSDRVDCPPGGGARLLAQPLTAVATRLGNARAANMVALGAAAGATGVCRLASLEHAVRVAAPGRFADLNLRAVHQGYGLVAATHQ